MALNTAKMMGLGMGLLLVGATGFEWLDLISKGDEGNRHIAALYCSAITLTTVGYGDICPENHDAGGLSKLFLVALSFAGLGFFCGPVMDYAAHWQDRVPGGVVGVAAAVFGAGVVAFTQLEGWSAQDAAYYCVITGTTIGYGDHSPSTDSGRLFATLYAVAAVNVVGGLLDPAKDFLSKLVSEPGKKTK